MELGGVGVRGGCIGVGCAGPGGVGEAEGCAVELVVCDEE